MGASSSYPTPALPSTRTVIVTGGNTGIGYETAKAIARMGARVIIACRSEERAKEVLYMNETPMCRNFKGIGKGGCVLNETPF